MHIVLVLLLTLFHRQKPLDTVFVKTTNICCSFYGRKESIIPIFIICVYSSQTHHLYPSLPTEPTAEHSYRALYWFYMKCVFSAQKQFLSGTPCQRVEFYFQHKLWSNKCYLSNLLSARLGHWSRIKKKCLKSSRMSQCLSFTWSSCFPYKQVFLKATF